MHQQQHFVKGKAMHRAQRAGETLGQPGMDAQQVHDGGKVSDLLAMLQSRYALSVDQLAAINALAKPAAPDADQAGIDEFVNEMGE